MILNKLLNFLCCLLFVVTLQGFNFNSTVTNISVGSGPTGCAVTSDGNYVYVANKTANTVSVVQTSTNTVIKTITGFDQPNSVTINPAGTKAYVTNSRFSGANTVSVITIATNTITATITGFNAPYAMAITSDGLFGYVTNYGDPVGVPGNTVFYVNLTTNVIVGAAITVGNYPATIAITPDDAYVYVGNYRTGLPASGTISVIDSDTTSSTFKTVIKTITSSSSNSLFGPRQIAINPSGTYAYVVNYGNNFTSPPTTASAGKTVSVIDINPDNTTFNTIVNTITVGSQPSGIVIDPPGNYAYVTLYANGSTGSLVTIQLSDNTVLPPSVTLGRGPISLVMTPNSLSVYVVNFNDNNVNVLTINDTFAISVFNIPANTIINVFVSNIYLIAPGTTSPFTTTDYVFSASQLTSLDYSIYFTTADMFFASASQCAVINASYTPMCFLNPVSLRIFVNGGGELNNFYFDILYTALVSGANSFNIDYTTQNAELITTAGTVEYPGTLFILFNNYIPF